MVRCRALALLLLLLGSTLAAAWLAGPLLRPERLTVLTGLAASLAWALVACWAWLTLATTLLALEMIATGGTTRTARLAPRLVRLVAATACGVGVAVTVVPTAGSAEPLREGAGPVQVLDGLELPQRVADPPGRRHSPPARVTVRRGDTLWDLAQTHGIDWQALYRANRDVVGADPDLIRPGMRLVMPSTFTPTSEGAARR
jgi:LysM repeat protein